MSNQVDVQKKLLLPLPEHLVPQSETGTDDALRVSALAGFLANGLKDTEGIESWIEAQAPAIAGLPPLPVNEQISPRQQIYDAYFDVGRHGGSTATIPFALGQVMGELSREFQLGTGLGEHDMHRLLDGLTAVLEAASEC